MRRHYEADDDPEEEEPNAHHLQIYRVRTHSAFPPFTILDYCW